VNHLVLLNACLAGFFAFAGIHYAIQWWFSRDERVLLLFAVQCVLYAVFSLAMIGRFQATTIREMQTAQDLTVTLGVLAYPAVLQLYVYLGNRRDRVFRAVVLGVLALLVVQNQWVPLRGTVIELQPMSLPGGGTGLLPIRTPPSKSLIVLYLAVAALQGYGFFICRTIWKRERWGAVLVAIGASAVLGGTAIAFAVDFAQARLPYVGATPHALFVVCMALFLSREYSARGKRIGVTQKHFESAFEHAPTGMAVLGADGQLLRVNRALCHILGASAEELCTRRFQDLTYEEYAGSVDIDGERLCAGEIQSFTVEKRFLRKDGEQAWALVAVSGVFDDAGRLTRFIAQLQDVTELRAHRQRLEELVATRTHELHQAKNDAERANAAKTRFLAHISHEIRTPLGVILGYTQLFQDDAALDAAQRKKIDAIYRSGKHLVTLVNDVLEISKIEAGRPELVEDRFDFWATLDELEQMFAVQTESKGIELTIERAPGVPRAILGDSAKVKQIVINLVSNAVKFTQGGSIRVRVSASALADEGSVIEIVIADTGIGIAAPDLERIFQPFEQLEAGARAGGTGLGLAISLGQARLMGGDLTAQSSPGIGSTFTFTFRAKHASPNAVTEARAEDPLFATPATGFKVLIVDDLMMNRDMLAELLSQPAYETRTAADGAGALSMHDRWKPDLVLMDLRMPEMDGIEAIRRMRTAGSRAAIGALSASALRDDEDEALAVGADFFMRKPYDHGELLGQIARVLRER
jgi:PAS domain S-box-containing protein